MKLKDRYGLDITITDLDKAVAQVGMFKNFEHVNQSPEQVASDSERKAYWTDLYDKLMQLQSTLKTKQNDN